MKGLIGAALVLLSIVGYAQSNFYDVTAGNGYGIRFWQDNAYKIHMGSGSEYFFGPVQDYSIKMNMSGGTPNRGWTWGVSGQTPIGALSTLGHFHTAGNITADGGLRTGSGSITSNYYGALLLGYGDRSDDDTYEWTGFFSGSSRQGIILYDGAWGGANNLTNEFSISAENGNKLTLNTQGTDIALMPKSGNVGIGTTAPHKKLEVRTALNDFVSFGSILGIGQYSGIHFGYLEENTLYRKSAVVFERVDGAARGKVHILNNSGYDSNSATLSDAKVTINYDGSVGIGTTAPINKLQIGPNTPGWSGNDLVLGNSNGSLAIHTDPTNTYLYGSKDISIRPGGYGQIAIYAKSDGNVGIGTTSPDQKLTVNGNIHAKEVKVDLSVPGPDYVFDEDYPLTSLDDLKKYIEEHRHLPEVPSAKEMEANGINLMEMNVMLLKKVEELTLLLIKTDEKLNSANKRIERLEKKSNNK